MAVACALLMFCPGRAVIMLIRHVYKRANTFLLLYGRLWPLVAAPVLMQARLGTRLAPACHSAKHEMLPG